MPEKLEARRGKMILLLILLLTAFLTCWKIWDEGYGNQYYTAAVQSMLTSWHNFFYASFDKGGFISVDKPALGLWVQCLFAYFFGVHGWSVILPQAICSLISVILLYRLVGKRFGEPAGLLAAFFMALTPIFIAVSRTNNLDATLVMVCLLAVTALDKAADEGSLGYLILTMFLLGLGFNVKMLQAYMFLPAVYLVYLFSTDIRISRRILHLFLATIVLLAVSLSWCLAVDLTNAAQRPFVGSSSTNSTLELAIGYNGLLRALPISASALGDISGAITQVPNEGNKAGVFRFFNREMFGQASWLLPMALFGLAALFIKLVTRDWLDKRPILRQLLLWSGIFVPMAVYFSISGHIHRYYLIMFAPCVAALSAIAVYEFYKAYFFDEVLGKLGWRNFLLPFAILVTAAVQYYCLKKNYATFAEPFDLIVLIVSGVGVALLLALKLVRPEPRRLVRLAAAIGIAGLLVGPAYWSYTPIKYGTNVITPFAGQPLVNAPTDNGEIQIQSASWERKWFKGADLSGELIPQEMVDYMLAHDNGSRWLLSVPNVMFATPVMLASGASVMAVGGFTGSDQSVSIEEFNLMAQRGEVQYVFVMDYMPSTQVSEFAKLHGKKVDLADIYENPPSKSYSNIYDLSGLKAD